MVTDIKTQETKIENHTGFLASCVSSISGLHVVYGDTELTAMRKLIAEITGVFDEDWPQVEYDDNHWLDCRIDAK